MNLNQFLDFILRRKVGHVLSQFTALEQKLLAAAERERTKIAVAKAKVAKAEAEALAALNESELALRVSARVRALLD